MPDIEKKAIDIEEYYSRYGPMVLRRCRQLLKDEEKALDAMQEVFVKLLLNKDRLSGTYPSSLLFRIATNVCLNKIRAQRTRQSLGKKDTLTNIAIFDEIEKRLINNNMIDYIFNKEKKSTRKKTKQPGTREIAVMHFVDGMTLKEVAAEVGLSVSGVRKRLRQLRSSMQNKEVLHGNWQG